MIDDFDFVREVFSCCKRKERKYITFVMQDSQTKLYKIAKAENIEKRFKVLHASNPNLTIKAVINDNVKSQMLKEFESMATGEDWLKVNDEDMEKVINKFAKS